MVSSSILFSFLSLFYLSLSSKKKKSFISLMIPQEYILRKKNIDKQNVEKNKRKGWKREKERILDAGESQWRNEKWEKRISNKKPSHFLDSLFIFTLLTSKKFSSRIYPSLPRFLTSFKFTFAPAAIRILTHSQCPFSAAQWRGVYQKTVSRNKNKEFLSYSLISRWVFWSTSGSIMFESKVRQVNLLNSSSLTHKISKSSKSTPYIRLAHWHQASVTQWEGKKEKFGLKNLQRKMERFLSFTMKSFLLWHSNIIYREKKRRIGNTFKNFYCLPNVYTHSSSHFLHQFKKSPHLVLWCPLKGCQNKLECEGKIPMGPIEKINWNKSLLSENMSELQMIWNQIYSFFKT